MEHYITKISINELRHLSNIEICLDLNKRQHLLITGKNGSGKTTLLLAVQKYLSAINAGVLSKIKTEYKDWIINEQHRQNNAKNEKEKYESNKRLQKYISVLKKYQDGIELCFNNEGDLDAMYEQGKFITAFFPATRKTTIAMAKGVEEVKMQQFYGIDASPSNILLKYMVHLKTQQAYARNENDQTTVNKIQFWFERFESALKVLLDNESVSLKYDFKEYDFKIIEEGRNVFSFNQLSDGYSSLINIVSDLIIRMDKNWLLQGNLSSYDMEGIVLIDELETHLHIELQKKILPFLIEFFPNIQFIITTHSPYILSSISNAKCYDLEKKVELENLSYYSSEELADGYFDTDEYSNELKKKILLYEKLVNVSDLSEDQRAERAKIRLELKNIPDGLGNEVKLKFEELERRRNNDDKN